MIVPLLKTGYTNHVDVAVSPRSKSAFVIVNKTVATPAGKQSRDVHIFEISLPQLFIIRKVKSYVEGVDMPGPAGYCSIDIYGNDLVVGLSIARADNPSEIVFAMEYLPNEVIDR